MLIAGPPSPPTQGLGLPWNWRMRTEETRDAEDRVRSPQKGESPRPQLWGRGPWTEGSIEQRPSSYLGPQGWGTAVGGRPCMGAPSSWLLGATFLCQTAFYLPQRAARESQGNVGTHLGAAEPPRRFLIHAPASGHHGHLPTLEFAARTGNSQPWVPF